MSVTYDLALWFNKEVYRWRTGAAVVWTLLLSIPVSWIFVTLSKITLRHPLQSIIDVLWSVCQLSCWSCVLMIGVLVSIAAGMEAKHYVVVARLPANRLGAAWVLLHPAHLVHIALRTVMGAVTTWLFTVTVGGSYSQLASVCPSQQSDGALAELCVNEHHMFVVVHGAFVGLLSAVHFFVHHQNQLTFPVIQQGKLFQAKTSLMPLLLQSLASVLHSLKYYYLLYYVFIGGILKSWAMKGLGLSKSVVELNSVFGLLDLSLLYYTLVAGSLVHALPRLASLLYTLYHTQAFEFSISSTEQFKDKCLQHALSCEKNLLVQYLGYQDLKLLTQYSAGRRRQVFSLSTLGGHPHNWIGVINPVLASLQKFTKDLTEVNTQAWSTGPSRQLSGDQPNAGHPGTAAEGLTHRTGRGLVNDAYANEHQGTGQKPVVSLKMKIWDQLKKRHAVAVFVRELPDYTSRQLFAQAQKYIWAVEALSYLVTFSFTEDSYGVVQKSLPEILTVLLDLQEAVERHSKLASNIGRRSGKMEDFSKDMALRCALRAALKSALYRISTTFRNHLSSVTLSAEHNRRLKLFTDYKE